MLWLVFALLPILFAVVAYSAAVGRLGRHVVVLAAIVSAALECMILSSGEGSWAWSHLLVAFALVVVVPWLAVLAFAWVVPLRGRNKWWATAAPAVYAGVLALAVGVGDITGWVPQ